MSPTEPDSQDEPPTHLADGRCVSKDELLPLVYDDLRRIASAFFRREMGTQTLQPTALVHEAYLRLADQRNDQWENRAHFLAIAGKAMRRVLVDAARAKRSSKRGKALRPVTLIDCGSDSGSQKFDLLDLEAAMEELGKVNDQYLRIIELRFFSGLNAEEIAKLYGVSGQRIRKIWAEARGWLTFYLKGHSESDF